MISTLLPRTATGLSSASNCTATSTATGIAMERQSVTAPDYRSVHGTGLPFAAFMANDTAARKARTTQALVADVPGSPPRGGPV